MFNITSVSTTQMDTNTNIATSKFISTISSSTNMTKPLTASFTAYNQTTAPSKYCLVKENFILNFF